MEEWLPERGIQFLSQIPNVDVDNVRVDLEVVSPNLLQDERPRENARRIPHEKLEQFKFTRGQIHPYAGSDDFPGRKVDVKVVVAELLTLPRRGSLSAADERPNTCQHFLNRERLHDVIVCTAVQSCHPVGYPVPRRNHQDGRVQLRPNAAANLKSAQTGQQNIEQDDVPRPRQSGVQSLAAVRQPRHAIPLVFQLPLHEAREARFVLYQQNRLSKIRFHHLCLCTPKPRWCRSGPARQTSGYASTSVKASGP